VFVSLSAGPLQFGHLVFTQFFMFFNGDSPVPVGSNLFVLGSLTGRSFSGTGTFPHLGHLIIGIGSPQYLCLEKIQSLNL
jgi:hypothetical protein